MKIGETVTVDNAIKKGHRMVTYPGQLIMLGIMGLTFFLGVLNRHQRWIWPVGFGTAIVLSWLFWSIKISKWKVWAFDMIRDVDELKRRAIQERLIWKDSSIFNRTEIWRASDKEKWKQLQVKFCRKNSH